MAEPAGTRSRRSTRRHAGASVSGPAAEPDTPAEALRREVEESDDPRSHADYAQFHPSQQSSVDSGALVPTPHDFTPPSDPGTTATFASSSRQLEHMMSASNLIPGTSDGVGVLLHEPHYTLPRPELPGTRAATTTYPGLDAALAASAAAGGPDVDDKTATRLRHFFRWLGYLDFDWCGFHDTMDMADVAKEFRYPPHRPSALRTTYHPCLGRASTLSNNGTTTHPQAVPRVFQATLRLGGRDGLGGARQRRVRDWRRRANVPLIMYKIGSLSLPPSHPRPLSRPRHKPCALLGTGFYQRQAMARRHADGSLCS